jgi:hypothetical protein
MRVGADLEEQGEHDAGQGKCWRRRAMSTPREDHLQEVSSDA